MNCQLVDRIVHAVLYEGYLLYPYRSSLKNRQRWTFGGLYPEAYCAAKNAGDASMMQVECLLRAVAGAHGSVDVALRFLHVVNRTEGERRQNAWQEAVEREVRLDGLALDDLSVHPVRRPFSFASHRQADATVTREQQAIQGSIEVSAVVTDVTDCYRLTVRIRNETELADAAERTRDDAVLCAFASTHTVLVAHGGEFVSMTDPPADCGAAVAACRNIGVWPVLVGAAGERDTMLASPIILYDYPELAPESPGDFFDGTEIDEMLALRVMTLSDDEKCAMAAVDERARAILERTETMAREQIMSLHGTVRGLRPIAADNRGGAP